MSFADRVRRVSPGWWVAIFAIAIILPNLSFGFWEPWELKLAERARDMATSGSLFDVTVGKRFGAEPPLELALTALGMKVFGSHEFGARLGGALCGVLAILAVYWAGLGLFRRRAALLGALALGSMPIFLFQARQLTSDMALVAGLALAMGGLGRWLWPGDGERRLRDLGIAGAGLLIGLLAGGALMGVVLPLLTLCAAVMVGFGLRPRGRDDAEASPYCAPGVGRDVPADKSLGLSLLGGCGRDKLVLLLLGLGGLLLLVVTLTSANVAGQYSLLLGGTPRGGTPGTSFEYLVKQIGFGLFPWSALAIFALGRPLIRLGGGDERDGDRFAFGQLYLLIFAAFGFALGTVFLLMTGEARFPALAPVALAIGALLDEALEGERPEPVLGLLVATGTMVVARDLVLTPEELLSVHTLAKVKWPPNLKVSALFMGAGLLVSAGLYTGMATRGRALGRVPMRELGDAKPWRRRLEKIVVEAGRWGIQAAVAAAVLFTAISGHWLIKRLSDDLSFKPVIQSYTRFAQHGEPIGRFKVEGESAGFYSKQTMSDLPTQAALASFLQKSERVFALVPAAELAALDSSLQTTRIPYFVVDASSSRFLLISNRLQGNEQDESPLRKNVWMAPRAPVPVSDPAAPEGGVKKYDWFGQRPDWSWRIPTSVMFGDGIELVGADFPESVRRPGTIRASLYFRVHKRPPAGFKVFVHFDTPGEPRLIGDHAPLNGAFPTEHWLPGEYVRDSFDVDVPLMTTPAGTYTVLVGFWPGGEGKRLKITAGPNDGGDRARLGTIEVK